MWTKIILGVLVVVAGIFLWLHRPAAKSNPTGSTSAQTDGFDFVVKDGTVTGPETMKTTEGHKVTIHVTADTSDEVHLHGYDLHADVSPTQAADITLTATTTGRFEIELENAKKTLSFLEVEPR